MLVQFESVMRRAIEEFEELTAPASSHPIWWFIEGVKLLGALFGSVAASCLEKALLVGLLWTEPEAAWWSWTVT